MFSFTDHAFAPRRPLIQQAINRLPEAHQKAMAAGNAALHQKVVEAAELTGLKTDPIVVTPRGVDIADGEDGNALFDHEFGTPEAAPNSTLRNAVYKALPEATAVYHGVIRKELGIG